MAARIGLHAQHGGRRQRTAHARGARRHYPSPGADRKRRTPQTAPDIGRRALVIALAAALALLACQDFSSGRLDRQDGLQQGTFGRDDRLTAAITPGRFQAVDQQPDGFHVSLRANAPWPSIVLVNGNPTNASLILRIDNADPNAERTARLRPLATEDRAAADCARTDAPPIEIAPPPLDPIPGAPGALRAEVVMPPCARMELDFAVPGDLAELRIAVVGTTDADGERLRRILDDAERWEAHHAVFLGGITQPQRGEERFDRFRSLTDNRALPVTALPGPVENRAGVEAFQQAFGPTTFHLRIASLDFLALDTSAGTLAGNQFRFVADLSGVMGSGGLAFMSIPPIAPDEAGLHALHSGQQGARLLEKLMGLRIEHLFASNGRHDASSRVADLTIHQLDARERARYARVTITDPWGIGACPASPEDEPGAPTALDCPPGPHVRVHKHRP